jgi:hypothetical protein
MEVVQMTAVETEYKGHPTLELSDGDRKVTLGLTKLKAVLANLAAVQSFIAKHAETAKADTTTAKKKEIVPIF